MPTKELVLESIAIAVAAIVAIFIVGAIPFLNDVASYLGMPGAWLGVVLFGAGGHPDGGSIVGILLGELLFFGSIAFAVLAMRHRRRNRHLDQPTRSSLFDL